MTEPDQPQVLGRAEALAYLRDFPDGDLRAWLLDHFQIEDHEIEDVTVRVPAGVWHHVDEALNTPGVSLMEAVRTLLERAERVDAADAPADEDPIRVLETRLAAVCPRVEAVPLNREVDADDLKEIIDISREVDIRLATRPPDMRDGDFHRLMDIARWMYQHKMPTAQARRFP